MTSELLWTIRGLSNRVWLVARHRPFFICPFCKGAGGEVSGYYEPEWSECSECWPHWDDLDDHGWKWFAGRMPLWKRIRSAVAMRCGLWYAARIRDALACKLGWHDWIDESPMDAGLHICRVCYEHKYDHTKESVTPSP